jgi:acetyl-CoA synthetase
MTQTTAIAEFLAARDLLLECRGDYQRACREFRWPQPEQFNWALDYFDGVLAAERGDQEALRLIEDDGSQAGYTFAELADRSSRLAGWLAGQGVRRGMRVLLVLGNQVELWESMLACIKLGAVIIPATTLLSSADLADRLERGAVGAVIARAELTGGFGKAGDWLPIAVGEPADGWLNYADHASAHYAGHAELFVPDQPTAGSDPLLLYFTSGTTSKPKLVEHTQLSCRPCTGSACGRATCTSTCRRRAGPSTPGPASSHRGTPRPPCCCSTTSGSTRAGCWTCCGTPGSPRSARRRRSGGCWCSRI